MPNAPSVPGSVPQQPAMEVDEPHPLMIMAAKLMSHTRTDDQSDRATSEMEVDFGGDQDEVEPETLQDSWLLDLCANHPHIAKKTAQVMAHLIGRKDLLTRVENMFPGQALLEVKAVEL